MPPTSGLLPQFGPDPVISLLFQLQRQLGAAGLDDSAVHKNMHVVRLDIIQDALVVCDDQHAKVGTEQLVDTFRNDDGGI